MRLVHYSRDPFVLDRTHVYPPTRHFKPNGLWVSVEGGEEDDETWFSWCITNEFHLADLAHRTEIVLLPDANVRHLATADDIVSFSAEFPAPHAICSLYAIDWARVQAHYGGLIIAPYQWSVRLDVMWYYGWDCASACLWDVRLIDKVVPVVAALEC